MNKKNDVLDFALNTATEISIGWCIASGIVHVVAGNKIKGAIMITTGIAATALSIKQDCKHALAK